MTESGVLFHAKHAFMPNNLGYCGPDDNTRMLQWLERGKPGEELVRSLQKFEAAYPFLRLIARSTGKQVFDYPVPEAYWIGNGLLRSVPVTDFYSFSHRELKAKDEARTRELFKRLDGSALPHHTFYVMSTYAASTAADAQSLENEGQEKLAQLIDNCRISWGRVTFVGGKELEVSVTPVRIARGALALGPAVKKMVSYNPRVKPFGKVRTGDAVSLHWNYACDILTGRQVKNIVRYTDADLSLVNRFLKAKPSLGRS